jgi:hypothetical protein
MKNFVFIVVLTAAAAFAGETISVGGVEPPTEYNAHWQFIGDGEVGCVRDGLDVYGSNDYAILSYFGFTENPISLYGFDGVWMIISYMQAAADDGDYCTLYLSDSDYEHTMTHTFEDQESPGYVTLMLDGLLGTRDLRMSFHWVSDSTGFDEGFRLYSIEIYGCVWGEGTYTNIFTWDTTEVTGHQTYSLTDMIYGIGCLSFEYGTDLDTQGWWALDNVNLTVNGESVLPRRAGGYGVEDFGSGGWYQDQHGRVGDWEIGTDHDAGEMSGANWQSDSASRPGWHYEAETFSPWFLAGAGNNVNIEFDTWYHPAGTFESASLGFYQPDEYIVYGDFFHDLDDWYASDYGTNVVETSWGAIKAGF